MAYSTRTDVEQIFGTSNVSKWADLDGTGNTTSIATRITWSEPIVAAEINETLRQSQYAIPLVATAYATTCPTTITHVSATLRGVLLYESRGVQDYHQETGKPMHRLQWHADNARRALDDIRTGRRVLDAK